MSRPMGDVLRDMAKLAEELQADHGGVETKIRMVVYSKGAMQYAVEAMEEVVRGTTTANGDDGWWRIGSDGLDVVVGMG